MFLEIHIFCDSKVQAELLYTLNENTIYCNTIYISYAI